MSIPTLPVDTVNFRSKGTIGLLLLIGVLVVGALVAARLSAAGERSPTVQPFPLPGLTLEELETLRGRAIKTAADMDEPHPTHGIIVFTTERTFFKAQGQKEEDFGTPDFDAYVVSFEGDLTAYDASTPEGVPPPTGRSAYFMYDANELNVTAWGIGEPSVLKGIGPSIPLDLRQG